MQEDPSAALEHEIVSLRQMLLPPPGSIHRTRLRLEKHPPEASGVVQAPPSASWASGALLLPSWPASNFGTPTSERASVATTLASLFASGVASITTVSVVAPPPHAARLRKPKQWRVLMPSILPPRPVSVPTAHGGRSCALFSRMATNFVSSVFSRNVPVELLARMPSPGGCQSTDTGDPAWIHRRVRRWVESGQATADSSTVPSWNSGS